MTLKRKMMNLLLASRAHGAVRLANRGKALVLMYHRFGDGGGKTPARAFAAQLDYLAARYRLVSLAEIAESARGGAPLPRGAAAITIDDGYRDAYTVAFPLLRARSLPATLFVTTDFADRKCWLWTDKARYLAARAAAGDYEVGCGGRALRLRLGDAASRSSAASRANALLKTLPDGEKEDALARLAAALGVALPALPPEEFSALAWDEAREMDAGSVRVASHTLTHPILTRVGDERLRRELRGSKARLEEALGRSVTEFCYPNGDADVRVRRETEGAGYDCAVSVEPRLFDPRSDRDPLALPRIPAETDFARFVHTTSGGELLAGSLRRRARGTASRRAHPSEEGSAGALKL